VVSSANSDPTVPETTIPWYFGTMQDDRHNITLARHLYRPRLKRVAVLRQQPIRPYGLPNFSMPRAVGHPWSLNRSSSRGHGLQQAAKGDPQLRPDAVFLIGDELERRRFEADAGRG